MPAFTRTIYRERDHCRLEQRYDGVLAPAWRRAMRAGGAEPFSRALAGADGALVDRLARDCVQATAAARRRLALGGGDRHDAAVLSRSVVRLRRLRRAGLAAIAGECR